MNNTLIVLDYNKDCFPPKMLIEGKHYGADYDKAISFLRETGIQKVQFKYLANEPASKAYFEGMFRACLSFCQN